MKKTRYYIVWIEGWNVKDGEKIKTLDEDDHTYTLRMDEALRVKREDLFKVEELLKKQGIADWCFWTGFVETSYAPKGTIYKTK